MKLKEITFGTDMKTATEVVEEVDKAVRSDKAQSFTPTQLNQIWSNLGIDDFTNEGF